MFQSPDHYHNLSLRLSEVLSDIGVNERIVVRRRRAWLLDEAMMNMHHQLNDHGNMFTFYYFGSQIEASTTHELNSDIDTLFCMNNTSVIQDWSEWKLGEDQLLMVQDETTSPGYCLLQLVRPDIPFPRLGSRGIELLGNTVCFQDASTRHGPAISLYYGPNQWDMDHVMAVHCLSWPKEAESWLQQQNVSGWPTEDMKRYAVEHGCFVVPVASRAGVNQDNEWRISTSLAERCLMFSLNMTQMRCYILMKMVLKTYVKPKCGETISSFMCKNVLFHCIADTRPCEWNESNLLHCLNQCLQFFLGCILTENCPHFIIPGNNLLAGKLSFQTKQQLVEIMMTVSANIEQSLIGISIDKLGNILLVKSGRLLPNRTPSSEQIEGALLAKLLIVLTASSLDFFLRDTLRKNSNNNFVSVYLNLTQEVYKLWQIYSDGSRLERAACCLYVRPLCTIIGSILASVNIHHSQPISPAALQWFSAGMDTDFSSSRLKLASALYCAGHYEQCEAILEDLNRQLEQTRVLCSCCRCYRSQWSLDFEKTCLQKTELAVIHENIAFCIKFLPYEVNCVPKELRYEMFRSTEEDLPHRNEHEYWMDWAVIDSIPFLYFLQYKVYSQLHRHAQKRQALLNLARTITTEPNLQHRETAMNLLGQCMKDENRQDEALYYFKMSLNMSPRNNAAKWHICILLTSLSNHRV